MPAVRLAAHPQARLRIARGRGLIVLAEWLVVLTLWQLVVTYWRLVNPVFLPAPLTILRSVAAMLTESTWWLNFRFSAANWLTGYLLAVGLGVTTGLVVGTFFPAYRLIMPLAWSLYATPHVAIRPMTVVWFGFGAAPIIFLIFLGAIFPIMLNTAAGVRTVEPSALRAARVFGANRLGEYLKVILPSTLPHIAAGMRLAIPTSLIGMLVGELVGSPLGLGALIALASSTFKTDRALAVVTVLVVISVSLVRGADRLQRRLAPWYFNEVRGY